MLPMYAANSSNGNSIYLNGGGGLRRGAPMIPSNAPSYPTPQDSNRGHSRQNSRSENNAKYHQSTRQCSPTTTTELTASQQQDDPHRPSGSSNAIAAHLQIPSSINNSKGSLPEFAAQVTCLFWFEASTTLLAVEDSRTPSPRSVMPLVHEAMPTTGFRKWVTTILSMTQVSQNVILLALMFIYRLKKHNPSVKGKVGSEFRLLTVALMLGNKFLDDNTYTNKTWADVSGISVQEIHVMEVEFLSNMRYSLYASKAEWDDWHVKLGKFADYYDKATDVDAIETILPTPRPAGSATLPSPVSQQASPPYMSQISPTNQGFPHPLSMPPYMPPMATASAASTPGSEFGLRKRSLEDTNLEPPAKRMYGSIPSLPSSTTLTPTTSVSSGGDDTFGHFPDDLRALISHALPNITVKTITYPKYETRGDLKECVGRFREWLENKVIDLEVATSTPSPTIDPSIHTILLGHSMGGIVAAETLLSIASDVPIPPSPNPSLPTNPLGDAYPSTAAHTAPATGSSHSYFTTLLFPFITALLSFDTPYLGINPALIAHGAEAQYRSASSAYSSLSDIGSIFGYGSKSTPSSPTAGMGAQKAIQAPPFPPAGSGTGIGMRKGVGGMSSSMSAANEDAAATPAWQRWGKYAMFAGAAGAVAAGGAAAYLKRDTVREGWGWMGSHLEFVGCLARAEELKGRLERTGKMSQERGVGFRDVVSVLGRGGQQRRENSAGLMGAGQQQQVLEGEKERTFCLLPKQGSENGKWFEKTRNDIAKDETEAHMSMFERRKNNGYHALVERAKELVVEWVEGGEWYKSSEPSAVDEDGDLGGRGVGGNTAEDGLAVGRTSTGSRSLMEIDLNDEDGGSGGGKTKGAAENEWATGEVPVFVTNERL
ncbi:uncharacterized protein KY384_004979 [Bacidia gigantensis]|uniref:uncharacterized protein n=1 Tax=Bacidia gigantensis TaxID=2732470 RepID=UPI001D055B57|nr:uncharacterized protein KY384_004979 [Bacidia gigantensis]KAG8530476.1 hypothetical protein KY384_004979 [Bacidia gigantensis]